MIPLEWGFHFCNPGCTWNRFHLRFMGACGTMSGLLAFLGCAARRSLPSPPLPIPGSRFISCLLKFCLFPFLSCLVQEGPEVEERCIVLPATPWGGKMSFRGPGRRDDSRPSWILWVPLRVLQFPPYFASNLWNVWQLLPRKVASSRWGWHLKRA